MDDDKDEPLKVSKDYKEGFNKADMLLTHMPNVLKGIHMPDRDETEWDKGFNDRLRKHEKEKKRLMEYAPEKPKALKELENKDKTISKDRGIERSK